MGVRPVCQGPSPAQSWPAMALGQHPKLSVRRRPEHRLCRDSGGLRRFTVPATSLGIKAPMALPPPHSRQGPAPPGPPSVASGSPFQKVPGSFTVILLRITYRLSLRKISVFTI